MTSPPEGAARKANPRKKVLSILLVAALLLGSYGLWVTFGKDRSGYEEISIRDVLHLTSTRQDTAGSVIASDEDPMLGLIATPAACWYDIGGSGSERYGLKPLLFAPGGELDLPQERFILNTGSGNAMLLGDVSYPGGGGFSTEGSPSAMSREMARHMFTHAAGALVVQDSQTGYELGLIAAPMASYLNIPVIVAGRSSDWKAAGSLLRDLGADYIIALGSSAEDRARDLGFKAVQLETHRDIQRSVLTVIQDRFGAIDYLTMTNPADVGPIEVYTRETQEYIQDISNVRVETGNFQTDIIGESEHFFDIAVPAGTTRVQIWINFTNVEGTPLDPVKETMEVEPMIFAYLYDTDGRIAAFAPSFSLGVGQNYLETQTFDHSGGFELRVKVYYGIDGLNTFAGTNLGISRIDGVYTVEAAVSTLESPHMPLYPDLSMMAPYLTASHGGALIADPEFELTQEDYEADAAGYATTAGYEPELGDLVNRRVDYAVQALNDTVMALDDFGLMDGYLGGPAWLAILAGPNMVPQHYVPKDPDWVENVIYGAAWPTDNWYNMGEQLSVARPLGHDVGDVSALIARTLFFEDYAEGHTAMIKQQWGESEDWGTNFHFLAGEMGGRTGWFFWQNGFATEVEEHGFNSEEYYREKDNDRQTMLLKGAYERANYFDMMVHGNWYCYVPELNGIDSYSTGVRNSDILKAPEDWELGPSTVVSGSCLLGRIDGIPPAQSITTAFIHAGINALFAATRSTGSEAKAGTIETSLIYDDVSVGEAMRADKLVNREAAAYYVRLCFGDPAFNPYEPENGYSDQGRPVLA